METHSGRNFRQLIVGLLACLALTLSVAVVPASAATDSGYKNCNNTVPYTRSYSAGATEIFPPGGGYAYYNNGYKFIVREKNGTGAGYWVVWAVYLSTANTWSGCRNYG